MKFFGTHLDVNRRHAKRPNGPTLADNFWRRVSKDGPFSRECGSRCWVWTGSKTPSGYGQMNFSSSRRPMRTHAVSWAIHHNGQLPEEGQVICHRCDNPPCCNPDHLFVGSPKDNALDAQMKGRIRVGAPPRSKTERPARTRGHGVFFDWIRLVGFSENQCAKALGVSRQAVNWWAAGRCVPSPERALEIEEFSFGAVPASSWGVA